MNNYYKNVRMRGLDGNTPIYKFIPLKYVKSMLTSRQILISKTSTWEDPYENIFYKHLYKLNDGTIVAADNLIKCIYGQCWTTCMESDALWRIYSRIYSNEEIKNYHIENPLGDCAVRIATTAGKLFDVYYTDESCMSTHSIGKICYMEQNDLDKWLSDQCLGCYHGHNLTDVITNSLFIKRKAFEHEQEVRVIINMSSEDERTNLSVLSYDIDPSLLFDEFCLDPRLGENDVKSIRNQLTELNVPDYKIKQSNLYKTNNDILCLNM